MLLQGNQIGWPADRRGVCKRPRRHPPAVYTMTPPLITIVSRWEDLESFQPETERWMLELQVFLGTPPGSFAEMFTLLVCSREWLGSGEWSIGSWFQMHGRDYAVPWPCLILASPYRAESLRSAVTDMVTRCFTEAQGDRARFMHLMRPFVGWESDASPPP